MAQSDTEIQANDSTFVLNDYVIGLIADTVFGFLVAHLIILITLKYIN